ncbi:3-oxoacyl-[acyl-carrier protein] reductase [Ardenticatena maritima]|uniref:3-oxoacyl-[acyl-carrier protein] reductase n=1 Tax=Ardenticatena maritima TaxID=872965 RepID=A0A0M9UBB4_9CHLR|nr:SDR family oxidoreductase [Ardenticatena maritima]KPL87125.1 hypothetical protein SE16_11290 [Ardenticatena maritima]GAP61590.1 3-oxoacyl-[acyl-carrier protein] reductase [Ardenticatena maritima]
MKRVALITGSTRRIGRAIAARLAREGYALALNYRHNERAAQETVAALAALTEAVAFRADVSTPEGAEHLVRETLAHFGRVDVLVNCVGPFVPKPLAETDLGEWRLLVDGNLGSAFYTMRLVIPVMREQGGGVIVNLGSLNAGVARGAPNTAVYNALKTALVVLTRSVARSEGRHGIRANVVNPGMIDPAGVGEEVVRHIPLQRLGTPDDVAAAVAWLCSDEATYVSGAVVDVHGGLWA